MRTHVILLQEGLGIVVAVDVDFSQGIVQSGIGSACLDARLEPGKDQLQTVALLDFVDKFVDREVASNRSQEVLDGQLITVDIQKTTNDLRAPSGVDALDIHLDEVGKTILVEIEHQVVDKVEAIADNDEGELIRQLGFLQEVLDLLRVVEIALAADALHFSDLASARRGLNILEVDFRILVEIDDGTEIVVET